MLLIFATNDWFNEKEIWYDENNICRIQSQAQQYWCLHLCWLYAPHWLLGSWKKFENHTLFRLSIKCSCYWWATWICKAVSWWDGADVGRCRRFIRTMVIFSTALRLLFPNLIYWESSFYRAYIFNIFLSIIMKSRAGLMPALQKWKLT